MTKNTTTKSSYCRHNKRPCKYSDLFYQWRRAVVEGNHSLAERLSAQHRDKFGPGPVRPQARA